MCGWEAGKRGKEKGGMTGAIEKKKKRQITVSYYPEQGGVSDCNDRPVK